MVRSLCLDREAKKMKLSITSVIDLGTISVDLVAASILLSIAAPNMQYLRR